MQDFINNHQLTVALIIIAVFLSVISSVLHAVLKKRKNQR